MSKRTMAPLVAVGLVFAVGGHEVAIDRGNAHAGQPGTAFAPFSNDPKNQSASCEIQPSSGCMELLPRIGFTTPVTTTNQSASAFCFVHEDSSGASETDCLTMGF